MTVLNKFALFLCVGLFSLLGNAQDVEWMSWDQAVERAQTDENPKKIFIDVYTDWCGWCKKMDKDTFQHPDVATYMADNFYMVKMDGEGKEPSGRKGYHEFAAALMQGRMSYPTTIFLDEEMNMLSPVPGYQKPEPFLNIARYFGDNIYLEKDWQTYSGQSK